MTSAQNYCPKFWICYALRNSPLNAYTDANGIEHDRNEVFFQKIPNTLYVITEIMSKMRLNKGHYTNSAEFPPSYNTYRLWRHFSDCFSPPSRPFFLLEICSDIPSCNTQCTSKIVKGPIETPFYTLHDCVSMGGCLYHSTRHHMFIMHQIPLVLHGVLASPF